MGEQIQRAVLLSHLASNYKHDSPKPAENDGNDDSSIDSYFCGIRRRLVHSRSEYGLGLKGMRPRCSSDGTLRTLQMCQSEPGTGRSS